MKAEYDAIQRFQVKAEVDSGKAEIFLSAFMEERVHQYRTETRPRARQVDGNP